MLGVMYNLPLRWVQRRGRGGVCQFTSDGIGVVRWPGNEKPLRAYLDRARLMLLTGKIIGGPAAGQQVRPESPHHHIPSPMSCLCLSG